MSDETLFIVMVFIIGMVMSQSFVAPLMGSSARAKKSAVAS